MWYWIPSFVSFLISSAIGEYRTFELKIVDTNSSAERYVVSTLDHWQYPDYYHVRPYERVDYVDSWMCWGRTDEFKSPCPNPRPKTPAQPDSSNPNPK